MYTDLRYLNWWVIEAINKITTLWIDAADYNACSSQCSFKTPHVKIVSSQLQYLDISIRLVIILISKALHTIDIKMSALDPVLLNFIKAIQFIYLYRTIVLPCVCLIQHCISTMGAGRMFSRGVHKNYFCFRGVQTCLILEAHLIF